MGWNIVAMLQILLRLGRSKATSIALIGEEKALGI
jgi:hypothetical protein